jgi:hypothetical protein
MEILGIIVIPILIILLFVGLKSRARRHAPENRQTFGTTDKTAEIARLPKRLFAPRLPNKGNGSAPTPRGPKSFFLPKRIPDLAPARGQGTRKESGGFTPNGLKIDWGAPCYLTGQTILSCACEECKTWRIKHAQ